MRPATEYLADSRREHLGPALAADRRTAAELVPRPLGAGRSDRSPLVGRRRPGPSTWSPTRPRGSGLPTTPDGVPVAEHGPTDRRLGDRQPDRRRGRDVGRPAVPGSPCSEPSATTSTRCSAPPTPATRLRAHSRSTPRVGPLIGLYAVQLVVTLVYHVSFLRWRAATPGKLALGLRVRSWGEPGGLTWRTIWRRWFGEWWPLIVLLIPLVGGFAGLYVWADDLSALGQPAAPRPARPLRRHGGRRRASRGR